MTLFCTLALYHEALKRAGKLISSSYFGVAIALSLLICQEQPKHLANSQLSSAKPRRAISRFARARQLLTRDKVDCRSRRQKHERVIPTDTSFHAPKKHDGSIPLCCKPTDLQACSSSLLVDPSCRQPVTWKMSCGIASNGLTTAPVVDDARLTSDDIPL